MRLSDFLDPSNSNHEYPCWTSQVFADLGQFRSLEPFAKRAKSYPEDSSTFKWCIDYRSPSTNCSPCCLITPSLTWSTSRTAPGITRRVPSFTHKVATVPIGKPLPPQREFAQANRCAVRHRWCRAPKGRESMQEPILRNLLRFGICLACLG